MEDINNKKVIIFTGSTDGIGRVTLNYLINEENTKFILPVRNLEKGEKVVKELKLINENADLTIMKMDLSSLESIKSFVSEFNELNIPLDILVCNAGILQSEYQTTIDGYEQTFGVNHLGTSLLTFLLLPKLNQSTVGGGGNIVIVSSKMHDRITKFDFDKSIIDKSEFSPDFEYSKSKLFNLLFAKELQNKLIEKGSNIKVNSLHPGFAVTSIFREIGFIANKIVLPILVFFMGNSLESMGQSLASITLNKSNYKGKYFTLTKETIPSKFAQDPQNSRLLFDKTCQLLEISNNDIL